MDNLVSFNLRLPSALRDQLMAEADAHGVSATYLIRKWIELGLYIHNEAGDEFIVRSESGDERVRVLL